MDIEVLGNDPAPGRPFTALRLHARDGRLLARLVQDLQALVSAPDLPSPYRPLEWRVGGLRRRAIVCDPGFLRSASDDLSVVGFFGERNMERDGAALEEANADMVLEFRNYPGILSYSSLELKDGNWANLVLHDKPDTREYWRASRRHAMAAEKLSPLYYRTVRIHNGVLPAGLYGGRPIEIQRTKYWDFSPPSPWRAVRDLTPATA